jgi:hypothetical protein
MEAMIARVTETMRRRPSGPFWRLAPWFAALVLIVGIVMLIVELTPSPSSSSSTPASQSSSPPAAPAKPKSVPLSATAKSVAREFVTTAVARKNLAEAWKISGPNIRGGLTYAEWKTGNIPVVPYPTGDVQYGAPFKIDYSLPDEALIEVALLPKPKVKIKPQVFALLLRRLRGADGKRHWVVDSWVPRSSVPLPTPAGG